MKRTPYKAYALMAVTLFLLLSLPINRSRELRGNLAKAVLPLATRLQGTLAIVKHPAKMWKNWKRVAELERELDRVKLEKALLKAELLGHDQIEGQIPLVEHLLVKVIFRSPTSWGSSLWINAGSDSNTSLLQTNSPVVLGDSLVGVVDYVGKKQSRVRLITDSGLTPAVRAVRDFTFLAKGELQGSSEPLWRGKKNTLKGIGFNYDFPDHEGPARDLRTGEIRGPSSKTETVPIIKLNDLLLTTGMDGVFPAGLRVATVSKVEPLKEGAYTYTIEAAPTAEHLDNLDYLFILPPVGFDLSDHAPLVGELLPELPSI
jgi:rod shape-determining protein MreC